MILAFFAASDTIVNINLAERFTTEIKVLEDSIAKIRALGINDYESQSEVLNEQWAVAKIKNTGVSVRKVKPLIDLIRGKTVTEAIGLLSFMPSPTASQLLKLLKSANANAENEILSGSTESLTITSVFANEGQRTKRFRPRARGRVSKISRRNSHVTIVLDDKEN